MAVSCASGLFITIQAHSCPISIVSSLGFRHSQANQCLFMTINCWRSNRYALTKNRILPVCALNISTRLMSFRRFVLTELISDSLACCLTYNMRAVPYAGRAPKATRAVMYNDKQNHIKLCNCCYCYLICSYDYNTTHISTLPGQNILIWFKPLSVLSYLWLKVYTLSAI